MQNVKENGYRMQYRTLKNEGCEPEKHLKVNKIELKCFGIEFCYVVGNIEEGRKKRGKEIESGNMKKSSSTAMKVMNVSSSNVKGALQTL